MLERQSGERQGGRRFCEAVRQEFHTQCPAKTQTVRCNAVSKQLTDITEKLEGSKITVFI